MHSMSKTKVLQIIAIIILAVLVLFVIKKKPVAPTSNNSIVVNPDVIVDLPQPNDLVTSPMTVKGRARGNWYFEATMPGKLKDSLGNILVQQPLHAITDWMTTNYVDFNETFVFTLPATQYGTLEIDKDNPSGEPINDASFTVPVKFW